MSLLTCGCVRHENTVLPMTSYGPELLSALLIFGLPFVLMQVMLGDDT
jgi:hypothetical protein